MGRLLAALAAVAVVTAAVGYGAWYMREVRWHQAYRIQNPTMPPAAMDAGRPRREGPVLPELGRTPDGHTIKSQLLHGLAGLRALPQRHLPPVVRLGAPLLVVQQPVVPQVIEYMQDVAA